MTDKTRKLIHDMYRAGHFASSSPYYKFLAVLQHKDDARKMLQDLQRAGFYAMFNEIVASERQRDLFIADKIIASDVEASYDAFDSVSDADALDSAIETIGILNRMRG